MTILRHNYLTIPLPDGWEDASQVIALGPAEDAFRPNVVFSQEPTLAGETAATFAARQLPLLKERLTGYSLISEGARRFGPNLGFLREHEFHIDTGRIGQLQFHMVLAGRCLSFTVTHLRNRLDEARNIAEQVISRARLSAGLRLAESGELAEEIE